MSGDDNKRAVAAFVERCQNQHDLDYADEAFHPKFVNNYRPEGRALPETDRPASGFRAFYGALPLPPTGNRVELEFIDIFRVCDGRLIEHWTSMDISALRHQMRP